MVEIFYYDGFQKTLNPEPEGGPLVRYSDYAALEAQLAARTGAVRVKALEWDTYDHITKALCLFGGLYAIMEYKGMDHPFKLETRGWFDGVGGAFLTLGEAKAAAQADYEQRILSALSPVPEAQQEPEGNGQRIIDGLNDAVAMTRRHTFTIPEGYEAVHDAEGRATGEVRPVVPEAQQEPEKIDLSALDAWFPDGVPVVAVKIMFPEKSQPLTTAEVRHVLAALASSPAKAVTEALVGTLVQATREYTRQTLSIDEHRELIRDALKAAMEAGRHE